VAAPDGARAEAGLGAGAKVGVVGAGTMGNGIAQVFAQAGHPVVLVDVARDQLARAEAAIAQSLARLEKKGKIAPEAARAARGRIEMREDLESLREARLVVEAIVETLEKKVELFATLDRIAPADAILASNTSSISITRLGAATRRAARVVGMHFMNPPPVMQLVEVIRGLETSDATAAAILDLCRAVGKTPVEARDSPGFVSNRILMPMLNEAFFCLEEGVASAEGIDEIMKLGMSHVIGPLALADLIGLDVCLAILEVLHRDLGDDKYRPCPLLRRMVAAGRLGRKSGRGFYAYPPPA
jgi:3-hydroxybutyryl-CoA dehydrogenase